MEDVKLVDISGKKKKKEYLKANFDELETNHRIKKYRRLI
jgi:hypothetical protein